ncbi:protein kinase [Streptomyces sp. NPDC087440]|uniref:protein kinase domain-containing protein n=1 Tax=Streptomyces sp. NPDC087440 TaxID=3365790 RepID=UPI00380642E9
MGEIFANRYELIDPIGQGGSGAVWRSWDHRRHRYVAAKVLRQSDAHALLRFVREQALRIDHPHVLAPASWAADDDQVLFTMDLVSGGSLAHLIGDYGPLPPRFVCTLLDQLLSGLAALHAEGVVHRDIKPANILLEATGTGRPHLRLSDFGIAIRKGDARLTQTDYVIGTPGYLAPEQLRGCEPDFPADLYAVGLVALYLLQGRKPEPGELAELFADGTPNAPEDLPESLWQVLAGMLRTDPQARFRTATGARKALAACAELLPEEGPDQDPVEVFDQLGPLPTGFGPSGPDRTESSTPLAPPASSTPLAPPASSTPLAPPASSWPSTSSAPMSASGPVASAPTPMSQTGSYYLAPPPSPGTSPVPPPPRATTPFPPQTTTPLPQATAPLPHAVPPAYVPPPVAPPSAPAPRKRPGPPPKVAVPVLLVALICFAVGIWALTQA